MIHAERHEVMRTGRTIICAAMPRRDETETVPTAGRARATRSCMPKSRTNGGS